MQEPLQGSPSPAGKVPSRYSPDHLRLAPRQEQSKNGPLPGVRIRPRQEWKRFWKQGQRKKPAVGADPQPGEPQSPSSLTPTLTFAKQSSSFDFFLAPHQHLDTLLLRLFSIAFVQTSWTCLTRITEK